MNNELIKGMNFVYGNYGKIVELYVQKMYERTATIDRTASTTPDIWNWQNCNYMYNYINYINYVPTGNWQRKLTELYVWQCI